VVGSGAKRQAIEVLLVKHLHRVIMLSSVEFSTFVLVELQSCCCCHDNSSNSV